VDAHPHLPRPEPGRRDVRDFDDLGPAVGPGERSAHPQALPGASTE